MQQRQGREHWDRPRGADPGVVVVLVVLVALVSASQQPLWRAGRTVL